MFDFETGILKCKIKKKILYAMVLCLASEA